MSGFSGNETDQASQNCMQTIDNSKNREDLLEFENFMNGIHNRLRRREDMKKNKAGKNGRAQNNFDDQDGIENDAFSISNSYGSSDDDKRKNKMTKKKQKKKQTNKLAITINEGVAQ